MYSSIKTVCLYNKRILRYTSIDRKGCYSVVKYLKNLVNIKELLNTGR